MQWRFVRRTVGKFTLLYETLYANLANYLGYKVDEILAPIDNLQVPSGVKRVVLVDQSPIGKTPRSNPATYTKLFDQIRKIFADTPEAKIRSYSQSRFSFNMKGGRCEACQGDGQIKVDDRFQLDSIKVESAWNKGITGKDVVIGFVDSAPDFKNLRVREKFRGYNPSTQELNFEGNFKSFVSGLDLEKVKDFNHCTVLIDIAMGGEVEDVNNNLKIAGVSPSAKWICAVSFNDGFGKMSDILKGAEWMLAPDDDPDLAPDIVNISWGTLDKNDEWFQYVHDAIFSSS